MAEYFSGWTWDLFIYLCLSLHFYHLVTPSFLSSLSSSQLLLSSKIRAEELSFTTSQ